MIRDIVAIIGVSLVILGFYFIYWPISLILSGTIMITYCLIATWQDQKGLKDDITK